MKNNRSIISAYYVMSALFAAGMGFIMGVYSNFLRSAGLDEFWVNMVNVFFFIVITICEIPTGIFADIFGRKGSFIISCFLETVSFTVYGFSKSFWGFVVAETIGAVGKTFASGAFDAWLVDSLKHNGEDFNLLKIFSKRDLICKITIIATAIIGGYFGDHGLNLPFFMSGITYFICGIVAIFLMKEVYFEKSKLSFVSGIKEIKDTWKKSVAFTKTDTNFRFILIIMSIQMFAVMAPNMEWQKIFSNLGFNNSANGIIGGLINVAIIIGILLSQKDIIRGEKKAMFLVQILIGSSIVLTVLFTNIYPVIIFFFLHEIGRGMFSPMVDSYTQKCITSSKERATLSSFGSMAGHFGGALGLLISGVIAKYAGISSAWIVSGAVLIIVAIIVGKNNNKS
jgi:MFS family permease